MIEIRDYVTNIRYIRRPSSELGDYGALVSNCFNYFNRNRETHTVHFHFRRDSRCENGKLLKEDEWANGSYEVLYAHFVRRVQARGQSSLGFGHRARKSTTPPEVSSPESPWKQPQLPNLDDEGFPIVGNPPAHPVLEAFSPAPTPVPPPPPPPPAPLQPPLAVRRAAMQRRNTNSTTVYSIGPPIPTSHYSTKYFSAPYIFIPLRPAQPRPRSHAQRYSDPFPGFRSLSTAERIMLREDQPEQEVSGPGERASDESSLESFDFDNFFDVSSEVSQYSPRRQQWQGGKQDQEGLEEEGRVSVARSQDSFGRFVTEKTESPLFVTDESERDFQGDLAWETDDEEVGAREEQGGSDSDEGVED
ncbi:unnamed protein product [Alternaria burnsii]|nr:unnamed protein product [Alternaria burnsii]